MAVREGGGTKVFRGLLIAVCVVAAIVLVAVLWGQLRHAIAESWYFVADHFPTDANQRIAVIVYLVLAIVGAVIFSKAGHFTAYGIAAGLGTLLWLLFWEGFPPLGLSPKWTGQMGLDHLDRTRVALWAVVAVLVITLVFVPLEFREKYRRRRHSLAKDE
ncbi:MAG TPA: hypothetical protein VKB69_00470 [Micromonosporaceae bacterium]|nr:hypothetical protein [Micromonosporaceae bacterium]